MGDNVVDVGKNEGPQSVRTVLGDAKTQAGDVAGRVQGAAQDLYGQAQESASQVADAGAESADMARRTTASFESAMRNMVETQPYTAMLIALAIGWLFGRTHRLF